MTPELTTLVKKYGEDQIVAWVNGRLKQLETAKSRRTTYKKAIEYAEAHGWSAEDKG